MNNLGKRVRDFRLAPGRNWTTARMAEAVGTSRQNIENLEKRGFGHPRYIAELARVMGTTVDDLLQETGEGPATGMQPPAENTGPVVKWSLTADEAAVVEAYRASRQAALRLKELTDVSRDLPIAVTVSASDADTNVTALPARESGSPGGLRLTAAQKERRRAKPVKKTNQQP